VASARRATEVLQPDERQHARRMAKHAKRRALAAQRKRALERTKYDDDGTVATNDDGSTAKETLEPGIVHFLRHLLGDLEQARTMRNADGSSSERQRGDKDHTRDEYAQRIAGLVPLDLRGASLAQLARHTLLDAAAAALNRPSAGRGGVTRTQVHMGVSLFMATEAMQQPPGSALRRALLAFATPACAATAQLLDKEGEPPMARPGNGRVPEEAGQEAEGVVRKVEEAFGRAIGRANFKVTSGRPARARFAGCESLVVLREGETPNEYAEALLTAQGKKRAKEKDEADKANAATATAAAATAAAATAAAAAATATAALGPCGVAPPPGG